MKRLAAILMLLASISVWAQTGIGKWRDCLDYSKVFHIEPAGDLIYAAARGGVFWRDLSDNSQWTLSKASGLSDVGVADLAIDPSSNYLVIAYNNSNIDLYKNGATFNISDIKRSDISGDKSIYSVRFRSGRAWVCCGFGIVVVDLGRHEIAETYYIGTAGSRTPVYDVAWTADSVYAATGEGLKGAAAAETHLDISDRWSSLNKPDSVTLTMLDTLGGALIAAGYGFDPAQFNVYMRTATDWSSKCSGILYSMRSSGSNFIITWDDSVTVYDSDLNRTGLHYTPLCLDAAMHRGSIYVGHAWMGLGRISDQYITDIGNPPGPFSGDNAYRMRPFNYRMMLCPGGHSTVYANSYLQANLFTTDGRQWNGLDLSNGILDTVTDLVDALVNPNDTTEIWAALWGQGVLSIRDNQPVTVYDETNTGGALSPYVDGSYRSLRTGALAFDRHGRLWVLTALSSHALARRDPDGSWHAYNTEALSPSLWVDQLAYDSINDYLWFCGRENMIYVVDADGRMAKVNPNNGSKLSTEYTTALVQDHDGNLWLGTNKGIKVIYNTYNAFSNGGNGETSPVTCSNITITNGEFAEYLMAYENITAIAVDGANRKWVGTNSGGLYLLSANGLEQLAHFTAANSPLFADKIVSLAVQPRTGEVYVGTLEGLQVFRGTATYADAVPGDEVSAFPNPVRPDYDGPIAIKGFTRNGLVHITDAAGHIVFATQAEGGQAVWYGRNHNGERVSSGVYYIFAADSQGRNRSVGKVLILR